MKRHLILIFLSIAVVHPLYGAVRFTATHSACNDIGLSIYDEFIEAGKKLPSSWDEFAIIREIKSNSLKQNSETAKKINTLAIVPASPAIREEQGIIRSRWNQRLFAISRTWNFDYTKTKSGSDPVHGGRFAILITPDKSSVFTEWIPETEVQIILRQLGDFDPKNQPLAFENLEQVVREKENRKEPTITDLKESHEKKPKSGTQGSSVKSLDQPKLWIVAIALLVISGVWFVIRKRKLL